MTLNQYLKFWLAYEKQKQKEKWEEDFPKVAKSYNFILTSYKIVYTNDFCFCANWSKPWTLIEKIPQKTKYLSTTIPSVPITIMVTSNFWNKSLKKNFIVLRNKFVVSGLYILSIFISTKLT